MTSVTWRPLRGVEQGRLSEARVQAHYAAQWLARAARGYVAARPDDSHTSLGWDDAFGGFATHALPDGARLGLKIADLTLVLLGAKAGDPSEIFPLFGRRDADARGWLGRQVSAKGLDAKALDAPSPYEIPAHAIANGAAYADAGLAEFLSELAAWYSNAHAMLGSIREDIVARKFSAPPVRCWPHHFDLDTLATIAADRTVGVGFSPGDEYYNEPYFYISVYPEPDAAALLRLPAIGHWHQKDFIAAVAPASRIVAAKDQATEVAAFLHAAVEGAIKLLN